MNLQRACQFLENQYVEEAQLLRAATFAEPDASTIYIASDNLLAWKALEVLGSDLCLEIKRRLSKYRNGLNFKHQVLLGYVIPDPPTASNIYEIGKVYSKSFNKIFIVKYEIANGEHMLNYYNYADLLCYEILNKILKNEYDNINNLLDQLFNMFDGYGFKDVAYSGQYETYKLALALFVLKIINGIYLDIIQNYYTYIDKFEEMLYKLQREDGGFVTNYVIENGKIKQTGDANTETTSICVLALSDYYKEYINNITPRSYID